MTKEYQGRCFCGSVQFSLIGEPEAMAYCHCNSCRHWSAGPVSAFTLWKPEALKITRGEDQISVFDGNPGTDNSEVVSARKWCRRCGGHLFTDHPTMGVIDVPAEVIERFEFAPGFHVHYQETVHPMKDGLTKFRDLPMEAGGSGEMLAE
ncbi:MAG: GFA family protein [Sedimenticola sp.]